MALLTNDGEKTELCINDRIVHYIDRGEISFFRGTEALFLTETDKTFHMRLRDELSFNSLVVLICNLQELEFRKPEDFQNAVDGIEVYEFY